MGEVVSLHGGIKPRSAPPRPDERQHAPECTYRSGGWMALGECNCMSPVDSRESLPDREPGLIAHMLPWLLAGLIASAIVFAVRSASAMDHGFDKSDPTVQWFEQLKRPDDTPPKGSCCGQADAYSIEIIQDAIGEKGDEMGVARVTDGSPKEFPDGSIRVGVPNGTEFRFPKSKVNPLADGNPTRTAWAFFSVNSQVDGPNTIRYIYCVIQLPPGM